MQILWSQSQILRVHGYRRLIMIRRHCFTILLTTFWILQIPWPFFHDDISTLGRGVWYICGTHGKELFDICFSVLGLVLNFCVNLYCTKKYLSRGLRAGLIHSYRDTTWECSLMQYPFTRIIVISLPPPPMSS